MDSCFSQKEEFDYEEYHGNGGKVSGGILRKLYDGSSEIKHTCENT